MKTKLYALCGIFWFIMDCFWFFEYNYIAFIFGILTTITCFAGILIYHNKRSVEFYVVLATFSWIMLNMCSVSGDAFAYLQDKNLNTFLKFAGFIFIVMGLQALIAIFQQDRDFFQKFRKL